MQANKKDFKEIVIIALKLLIICAIVAALVASVNLLTKDRILLNQKIKTADALSNINEADGLFFSVDENGSYVVNDKDGNSAGSCDTADIEKSDIIDAVYIINDTNGNTLSYCVEASPMGFKAEISMIIAVNPDKTIKDVQIISLSDTKGIGDKVTNSEYLGLYKGRTGGFSSNTDSLKANGMIIAGATRTSEPVAKAIDAAVNKVSEIIDGKAGAEVE